MDEGKDLLTRIDWGAYYFFRFQARNHPALADLLQVASPTALAIAAGVVLLLALVVFALRRQLRAALVALLVFAAAAPAVEWLRHAIARRRPDDAENLLGAENMLGSYPASGVFLFTLALILLAIALGSGRSRRQRLSVGVATAVLIVGVSLSQFLLGLHFVTDVVGALLGGGGCALVAWLVGTPRVPGPETQARPM